jgi:two-component system, OmpR family, heavy metal sensor histidine kinase CusS
MMPPKPWKSIRFKMTVLAAILLGGILILYSFYLFIQLQNVLSRNVDAELKNKALELAKTIKAFQATKSPGGDIHYAALKVLNFDVELDPNRNLGLADRQWLRLIDRYNLHNDYISILSLSGTVLAESDNMPIKVREQLTGIFTELPRIRSTWGTIDFAGKEFRTLQMTILARDKPHYHMRIATPMKTVEQFLAGKMWAIVASIVIAVLLFSLVGLLLANQILRPVRRIAETAASLTHEDLSRRVQIDEVDTEMLSLVNAFNAMTERLESSFAHMAGMTAEMAHELKTPLAIIRGEGQMALRCPHSSEEYRAVIESSIMETERMLQVIDDLLLAANLAYDKEIFREERIHLAPFLEDIRKKSEILAEPKNIFIQLQLPEEDVIIRGDQTHLRRLLFNLLDNGIKNSPAGSVIPISVCSDDTDSIISIKDEGAGIASEDLPHIFERAFTKKYQTTAAKHPQEGSGLGLYLCRIIAEAHRGRISVTSQPGKGSTFSLYLPKDQQIS